MDEGARRALVCGGVSDVIAGVNAQNQAKVLGSPLTYATTTVMRQLDEDGTEARSVPMVSNMRGMSMATLKVLQSGHKSRAQMTQEQKIAREIINLLKNEFLPVEDYAYGNKQPSHLWETKVLIFSPSFRLLFH